MNCADVQEIIRGQAAPATDLPAEAQSHVGGCPACQAVQRDLALMVQGLRKLPPPELPPDFELTLRRNLARAANAKTAALPDVSSSTAATRRRKWIPIALAASLAGLVALGAGMLFQSRLAGPEEKSAADYYRFHLSVNADRAHPEALFEILLPDGVRLPEEAGVALVQGTTLRWHSPLQPGINELDLPLVACGHGGAITARMTVGKISVQTSTQLVGAVSRARRGDQGNGKQRRRIELALRYTAPATARGDQ